MMYLLLAALLWGTSFIAGKIAYEMAAPALVVLFRLLVASAVMLPVSMAFFREHSLNKKLFLQLVLLGLLTYPITFLLQFEGLKFTSASSAVAMIGIEPLMVVLVGHLFFKERATLKTWLLAALAFIGVVLVAGVSNDEQISLFGCLLVLLSTVVVAFWLRLSKKILQKVDVKSYTALSIQLGTLFGIPLIAALVDRWEIHFSWSGLAAIVYLGVGCSLLAGWLWNKGLTKTTASSSGIFLALEPVFGVCFAILLLGETLNLTTFVGMALVIVSAGMSILSAKK